MTRRFNIDFEKAHCVLTAILLIAVIFLASMIYTMRLSQEKFLRDEINRINEENGARNLEIEKRLEIIEGRNVVVRERIERLSNEVSRGRERSLNVVVTAYDLSIESCGKPIGSPGYGITASGKSLEGHSLWSARAIAVDPSVIPLGSQVRLAFDDMDCKKYDGIYTAVDTGGAVEGNHVDLFMGDSGSSSPSIEAMEFGCRTARAMIM